MSKLIDMTTLLEETNKVLPLNENLQINMAAERARLNFLKGWALIDYPIPNGQL